MPDKVIDAMSNTLGTDVSNIRVIANSKWANLLNWLDGFRGHRTDATTLKNTIYLSSHVSPQDFFNNSELMVHEYYHVVNQWNNGRMNIFTYLLSPNKWETEAKSYAKDRSYIPNHMLFYQGGAPMVKLICCGCGLLLLSGCFVPTDMVVNIEGDIVDGEGLHYASCRYSLVEKERELFSVVSSGEFRYSGVLGGFNYNKARLVVECDGGMENKKVRLPKPPKNITEYMSIGVLVIEKYNSDE